jgi:hypothetical protein
MQKNQVCEIRSCDQMPKLYVQFFLNYKDSELFYFKIYFLQTIQNIVN